MTSMYLGQLVFPLLPESLTLTQQAAHQRVTLWDLGEVTQLRSPGQLTLSFSGFFPGKSSFPGESSFPGGTLSAAGAARQLREMMATHAAQLFVVAGVPFPLSMQMTVEELTLTQQAGDEDGIHYALTLREYRTPTFTTIVTTTGSGSGGTAALPQRPDSRPAETRYTVVKGDSLWAIARRFLGSGSRYPEIARLNQIPNSNLIYPGQVLRLPEP